MTPRQKTGRVASTRCPFLVEETAQCCRLAPFRKLVPSRDIATEDQCCSTGAWRSCAWVPQGIAPGDRCPFLDELTVCSCAAAPSSKRIPRTRLAVRRCLGDSHRYCDFFLERVRPLPPAGTSGRVPRDCLPAGAAGIPIAPGVALASNHMWLDVGSDGSCHVGVDAFLIRVLGPVDDVNFLSSYGPGLASVALTVGSTTLPLAFPRPFAITRVNSALRCHLDSLTVDPYGRGWLYEGHRLKPHGRTAIRNQTAGMLEGPEAEAWMASEVGRLSRHVHTILSRRGSHLGPVLADGGEVALPLPQHLERAELLEVFSLFFSGVSGWRDYDGLCGLAMS